MSRDRADGRASVPATMPAWVPADPGGAMVRRTEVPVPVPHPGEALVAVEAYSVNRGETLLLERPREGWRPGKDLAGTVVRAATDGRGPVAGARVVGHPPAAALPLAGLTALRMVRSAGSLAGRRLLVTGASGGVGHYVVELAARAGAEVSALCASAERGERLRALGARHVLSDLPAPLPGRPAYDVVMESIGGAVLTGALALLAEDGLLLWFGQASRTPVILDFFSFFDGPVGATIRHVDYTRGPRTFGEDLATLVDLVATDRLHPELGLVRPWDETPEVIARLRARRIRGNAVLTMTPTDPEEGR